MTVLSSCPRASRWILLFSIGLLPCGLGLAQRQLQSYGLEGKSQFTAAANGVIGLGIGNFDQDGRLDIFGAIASSVGFTFFNDGNAGFLRQRLSWKGRDFPSAVAVGDVNGDKKLDLVIATTRLGVTAIGQTLLMLGDGQGRFADSTTKNLPKDGDSTNALALADVDGDGDLDLVLAHGSYDGKTGQQNRLYLNNGKGVFTDATKTHMPVDTDLTQAVVLGDLDGDGDLDMVLGNGHPWSQSHRQANKVYLNNGKGRFTDGSKVWRLGLIENTNDLLLVDLDGDGDLDLIEANGDLNAGSQNRVYRNLGSAFGFFELRDAMGKEASYSTSLAVADLDADGRFDVYVGNYRSSDRLLLGNGRGSFISPKKPLLIEDRNATACVRIADFDADGNPDILCGNYSAGLRLILGLGKGQFLETTRGHFLRDPNSSVRATVLADLDGDGNPDKVEAFLGHENAQNQIWLGDGQGGFVQVTKSHFPKDSDTSVDVIAGDVDGDGDLDLAFANSGQNTLYLNDGRAHFQDATFASLPSSKQNSQTLAFADVDGDKDLDMIVANVGSSNQLLLNNGKGRFVQAAASSFPKDGDETRDLILADLDGDGDLDLFLANGRHRLPGSTGEQNRIYLNDGKGGFTDVTTKALPKVSDASLGVGAADVDGDGDVDLFVGNGDWNFGAGRLDRLLLNNGKGRFTDASKGRIPQILDTTWSLVFADMDQDGDPDLLMLNFSRKNLFGGRSYLENNGKGVFSDKSRERVGFGWRAYPRPSVADLDRDGDLDIVVGRDVYKNRMRQIHTPQLARLGQDYRILFYAETAYGRPDRLAFPLLSLSALKRPVRIAPLGWLSLSPTQLYLGAPFVIPNNQSYLYQFPLPVQPSLVGLSIQTQGLFLHGNSVSQLRLGNWISDRILR